MAQPWKRCLAGGRGEGTQRSSSYLRYIYIYMYIYLCGMRVSPSLGYWVRGSKKIMLEKSWQGLKARRDWKFEHFQQRSFCLGYCCDLVILGLFHLFFVIKCGIFHWLLWNRSLRFLGFARSIETSELYSLSPISIGSGHVHRFDGVWGDDVGAECQLVSMNDTVIKNWSFSRLVVSCYYSKTVVCWWDVWIRWILTSLTHDLVWIVFIYLLRFCMFLIGQFWSWHIIMVPCIIHHHTKHWSLVILLQMRVPNVYRIAPEEMCLSCSFTCSFVFPMMVTKTKERVKSLELSSHATSSAGGRSKANEYLPATLAEKSGVQTFSFMSKCWSGRKKKPGTFWTQRHFSGGWFLHDFLDFRVMFRFLSPLVFRGAT